MRNEIGVKDRQNLPIGGLGNAGERGWSTDKREALADSVSGRLA
jgi:hypothetical protein